MKKTAKNKSAMEKFREAAAGILGMQADDLPVGEKWIQRLLERQRRWKRHQSRPRKPEPHFRAKLVARQKKARPRYPRPGYVEANHG